MIPLVVLFGWYSFGLFRQADTPAAANPFTGLEQFLEANNLSYGLGGYWDASVITVDTGGAVTIRAVSPSCMQPYEWENKHDWYDPSKNVANFLLLSNQSGYFTSFAVARHGAQLAQREVSRPTSGTSLTTAISSSSRSTGSWTRSTTTTSAPIRATCSPSCTRSTRR